MFRLRALAGLVVLAVTGLLIPASPAAAATPLTATITCDAETGAITTWVSGTLLASGTPTSVAVEFQRSSGWRVSATTSSPVAPLAQPFTVNATTTGSGDIAATGYTGTFDPATSVYYRETVLVTFKNVTSGAAYTTREATCSYDRRTTVTLTCDPVAGTVTAAVAGLNGLAGTANGSGQPTLVGFRNGGVYQATKDGPAFTEHPLGNVWQVKHRVVPAADGTWTDTGYVHTLSQKPYYYSEELTVGVFDVYGTQVGGGTATCVLYDGGLTPTA